MNIASDFCTTCHNLLAPQYRGDELTFVCSTCGQTRASTDEDTLRYQDAKGDETSKLTDFLVIGNDSMNPKVKVKCPKCSGKYARASRLGDDARLIYGCISCQYQWMPYTCAEEKG
jgi:DNA-directed RNA polymerase subunit M/transcription elongation factor TFIIS